MFSLGMFPDASTRLISAHTYRAADADVMATAWAEGCIIVARDYDMAAARR
jgi:predicted nuclease of predicted toxin-antitoxin system